MARPPHTNTAAGAASNPVRPTALKVVKKWPTSVQVWAHVTASAATSKAVTCPAIDGIIKEADEVAGEVDDKKVLDAALIAAAQAVEHYEMARYGTLVAWAKTLGRNDCASVLEETLKEEHKADQTLTSIADGGVNRKAA